MGREYEVNPVTFITIGTIGPPGQRVFHLQAGDNDELVTLIIEKEQAAALAQSAARLINELGEKLALTPADAKAAKMDMQLHEPILPAFRVGRLGLDYDAKNDRVMVLAEELLPEGQSDDPAIARFYATRDQMLALSEHALKVVAAGRPTCPLCGRPEDPGGHLCPKRNGHGERVMWA